MFSSVGFSTPRGPFAGAAPLAHRPLSAIAATIAGGVPQNRIQRIIAELIPVLEALHQDGRICGDISVHSVGLDESGRAHLMALSADTEFADRLQTLTPGYAPFELYTESSDWPRGPWTDIYALSAVAYSLVAGQRPPPAAERRIADTHQPLATLGINKYSEPFLQAIDAGLALMPADRPQTMQAYAELLALPAVAHPKEATSEIPEVTSSAVFVDARKPTRKRALRAVLLGVATLAVVVYWWGRLASGPDQVITHSESAVTGTPRDATPKAVKQGSNASSTSAHDDRLPVPESSNRLGAAAGAPSSSTSSTEMSLSHDSDSADATEPSASSEPAKAERKVPALSAPVRVSINVRPWGEIVIDGVSRGVTPPLKTVMLRPGKYAVTIRNSAQPAYHTTLVVTAGKPAVITHFFR